MKVVLFCGGLGTRIREYGENTPKPMIPIGNQPIWVYLSIGMPRISAASFSRLVPADIQTEPSPRSHIARKKLHVA